MFVVAAWFCWQRRNAHIFDNKDILIKQQVCWVANTTKLIGTKPSTDPTRQCWNGRQSDNESWRKPPPEWWKLNMDVVWRKDGMLAMYSFVCRDANEALKGGGQELLASSALEVEMDAIFNGIKDTRKVHRGMLVVEIDSNLAINSINRMIPLIQGPSLSLARINSVLLNHEYTHFQYRQLTANKIVDAIAKHLLLHNISNVVFECPPAWIRHWVDEEEKCDQDDNIVISKCNFFLACTGREG